MDNLRHQPRAWLCRAGLVLVALMVAVGIAAMLLTDRLPTNMSKPAATPGRHLLM